ncbi:MAG: exopolyphosphatase [Chitinophagaceae bacterium]|nr:MAG: exopolyphosphatase [Chitinophagaceae bacterium]
MLRFAAIDIGSNAVRLLIADIIKTDKGYKYNKNVLVRVPLRLGDDAFIDQEISDKKQTDLVDTMDAFSKLMRVFSVSEYLACATSAMREARNGAEVIRAIKKRSDLDIEIIAGQREANIIYANHIEKELDPNKNYLYIDVGGGSTELSVFVEGEMIVSRSFNIGTIRMLDNQDKPETWEEMKLWVKDHVRHLKNLAAIGTGGNINKLFKMSDEKDNAPLLTSKLSKIYKDLNSYSLKERMKKFDLKPDRADVIIPACEIFLTLANWTGIKQIYVPKVGMADGIINLLIEEKLT